MGTALGGPPEAAGLAAPLPKEPFHTEEERREEGMREGGRGEQRRQLSSPATGCESRLARTGACTRATERKECNAALKVDAFVWTGQ